MSDQTAKKAPGFLKNSVIYQINLRAFTPGGTLKSAEAMLPHIASLGVDLVYLCPVFLADDEKAKFIVGQTIGVDGGQSVSGMIESFN